MTKTEIIKELINRGYACEVQPVTKNGVIREGIRFTGGEVQPVIYVDELISVSDDIEDVVMRIIRTYEANKVCGYDYTQLTDANYVLAHAVIGLQRASDEALIKEPYQAEMEMYLRIVDEADGGSVSVKVTDALIKGCGVDVDVLWRRATANTFAQTEIRTMGQILCEMSGLEYTPDMDIPSDLSGGMYVVSSKSRDKGASAILNREALTEYFGRGTRLVVLPSSIHEVIVIPTWDDAEMYSPMVREINVKQVAPEERLSDRAWAIEL